jgi:hypothetical protein
MYPTPDRSVASRAIAAAWSLVLLAAAPAAAFTFRDGTTMQCVVRGEVVVEVVPPAGDAFYAQSRTGHAVHSGDRYRILWNEARLKGLPDEVHDFIFFHECAHVRLETDNEAQANCAGLLDMRAAGRAGPAVEARIRALFGPGNAFWTETFACADRGAAANGPAVKPAR